MDLLHELLPVLRSLDSLVDSPEPTGSQQTRQVRAIVFHIGRSFEVILARMATNISPPSSQNRYPTHPTMLVNLSWAQQDFPMYPMSKPNSSIEDMPVKSLELKTTLEV